MIDLAKHFATNLNQTQDYVIYVTFESNSRLFEDFLFKVTSMFYQGYCKRCESHIIKIKNKNTFLVFKLDLYYLASPLTRVVEYLCTVPILTIIHSLR